MQRNAPLELFPLMLDLESTPSRSIPVVKKQRVPKWHNQMPPVVTQSKYPKEYTTPSCIPRDFKAVKKINK